MWVVADVIGLFSLNVVSFSFNVGQKARIFSINVVPKWPMLSGRGVYVIGPLHIASLSQTLPMLAHSIINMNCPHITTLLHET
jgi:hypothetical protein